MSTIGSFLIVGVVLGASASDEARPGRYLSAASKRALKYTKGPEWFCELRTRPVSGDLAYERGVHRRDPSAVIRVGDLYYVWYTKSPGKSHGFGTGDPEKKVQDIQLLAKAEGVIYRGFDQRKIL